MINYVNSVISASRSHTGVFWSSRQCRGWWRAQYDHFHYLISLDSEENHHWPLLTNYTQSLLKLKSNVCPREFRIPSYWVAGASMIERRHYRLGRSENDEASESETAGRQSYQRCLPLICGNMPFVRCQSGCDGGGGDRFTPWSLEVLIVGQLTASKLLH